MKKLLNSSIFICTLKLSSKEITLSGFVKDSLQNPLPYANVIAKPKDVSKNLKFVITNNEGFYKLEFNKKD